MYRTDIRSANDEVIGIFDVHCQRLVGMASMSVVVDEAGVTSMAVSPEERGKGLGEALMLGLMFIASSLAVRRRCGLIVSGWRQDGGQGW